MTPILNDIVSDTSLTLPGVGGGGLEFSIMETGNLVFHVACATVSTTEPHS